MTENYEIVDRKTAKTLELPRAPQTASPVPWLTSLHGVRERGPYGDSRYRGNCSGYLIKDLLRFFGAQRVLDPMTGSATCRDVCRELQIECHSFDLRSGQDAADAQSYRNIGTFDFVWMHPPYWQMIRYNEDRRCLSNAETLDEFLNRLRTVLRLCNDVLTDDGKIAVLIGGYCSRGRYLPLASLALQTAINEGFWPTCTEIIRLQYGNTSSRKSYSSSFIPGLHDTCLVLKRDESR